MKRKNLLKDSRGDAIVEAAILFPIMLMIFTAIVILALYLPQGAILQRAVQYTAESLALERSDTGYLFEESTLSAKWNFKLHNTLIGLITGTNRNTNSPWYSMFVWFFEDKGYWEERAQTIVDTLVGTSVTMTNAPVQVTVDIRKTLLYSEFEVTATQEIPIPVDFSFIGFPKTITVKKTALYMIPDGDAYLRNVDDAFALSNILRLSDVPYDLSFEGIAYHLKTFLKTVVGLH